METIKYQVCIRCYTYNQSQYIVEALNSFVSQKTSFPYVIVVVDDASKDGEQDVIMNYVAENFNLNDDVVSYERRTNFGKIIYAQHMSNKNCYIASVLLDKNLYNDKEKKSAIVDEWRLQSKYEAICEGDDWWIREDKLQKQFDCLESHSEIDMCACGAMRMKGKEKVGEIQPSKEERILTTEETILGGGSFLATNSLMKRVCLYQDDYQFWKKLGLDYFYQIHGSLKGGIYFYPDFMAAYRVSADGSWTVNMRNNKEKKFFHIAKVQESLSILNEETEFKYDKSIKNKLYKNYFGMFVCGLTNKLFCQTINNYSISQKIVLAYKMLKSIF